MNCERCMRGEEARYRVHTDLIDMKVCEACAGEARKLGIAVELLALGEDKNDRRKSDFALLNYRLKLSA